MAEPWSSTNPNKTATMTAIGNSVVVARTPTVETTEPGHPAIIGSTTTERIAETCESISVAAMPGIQSSPSPRPVKKMKSRGARNTTPSMDLQARITTTWGSMWVSPSSPIDSDQQSGLTSSSHLGSRGTTASAIPLSGYATMLRPSKLPREAQIQCAPTSRSP